MKDEIWYCPRCGEESEEKIYTYHNGFVPIFFCEKCHDDYLHPINEFILFKRIDITQHAIKRPLVSPEGQTIMVHWDMLLKYGAENYITKEKIKNEIFFKFTLGSRIRSTHKMKMRLFGLRLHNIIIKTATIQDNIAAQRANLKNSLSKWLLTALESTSQKGC